jgi:GNAT superfamily N-acetyltransferase
MPAVPSDVLLTRLQPNDQTAALRLAALDALLVDDAGEVYSTEQWGVAEFLAALPGKWDYSAAAVVGDVAIGFWIVSALHADAFHTHRVGVHPAYRGRGVAAALFRAVRQPIVALFRNAPMTLEVNERRLPTTLRREGATAATISSSGATANAVV